MKFIKCSVSSDLWTNFNGIKNPQIGYVTYVKDFTENANFISYENLLYNNNFYPQYSEGESSCKLFQKSIIYKITCRFFFCIYWIKMIIITLLLSKIWAFFWTFTRFVDKTRFMDEFLGHEKSTNRSYTLFKLFSPKIKEK